MRRAVRSRPSSARARGSARGAALLLALLLTAFGAAVATQMLAPLAEWLARERRASDLNAAYTLADGATAWALTVLAADRLRGPVDHYGEPWATRLPATAIESGVLEGHIVDLQARFNINLLADPARAPAAARLAAQRALAAIGLDPGLAERLADALDGDQLTESGQSETQAYGGSLRNRAIEEWSDLLAIRGVGEAEIARLAAHWVILPGPTRINANTASPELLAALLPEADPGLLAAFVREREQRPLASAAELPMRLKTSVPEGLFSAGSEYFGVEARIRHGSVAHRLQLVVHRPASGRPILLRRVTTHD
ncbi:MAG: type II secretion system minor pseudopilin GspK [Casimicrobiaceae bacterium]|nr:type II secretion system minor pseudopilin GspK [Casimicrobiaceae bacterium]MCX8099128.1 type II secretion system minor pseudopilin GspK [Casimicrobiaceae bacterium]MDW8312195.1 type II secretion system minor pseudopilin GspK [Burkholderiales bacterium]